MLVVLYCQFMMHGQRNIKKALSWLSALLLDGATATNTYIGLPLLITQVSWAEVGMKVVTLQHDRIIPAGALR